jgi:galactofuranosylgalactofuranosylrhamnosyl-N-acetylglucosaminyl-diphospho-decaprenol beta-1,5/1,6-galactofuranosyltransferase
MREETLYPGSGDEPFPSGKAKPGRDKVGEVGSPALTRLSALLEQALGGGASQAEDESPELPDDWREPDLTDAVLQELRLSAPRSGPETAYRVIEGSVSALENGLRLAAGATLSFDTYLNSFYEHYWSGHAPVEGLTLRLFGTGMVAVEIYRAMPGGAQYTIGRQSVKLDGEGGGAATIGLDLATAGAGRIFFEVVALSKASIRAGRIEATSPPMRPVRLGIGLCTFNRERMLLGNLKRLVSSNYWRWAKPKVVIVNQGKSFESEAMLHLLASERDAITVVEQGNFGGAGGFTRSAMEIVRAGDCSHVLFMDDDIEIHPDILVTTHAFAARTTKPTLVGGAMLDLFRPAVMYEAGGIIGSNNILNALLHNYALDDPATLSELTREVPCHFNGWWYCAIPADAFRDHGLPMPIFIRGDDMEYGARLLERGIPTVSLPPVSVWHEPFYAKPPGWQLYYDLRNRLIFASCHPELVHLDSTGVILRRLVDSLLKHDYGHAELVIRGVEDFLAGPKVLDTPMDVLHREISALAAAHAPAKPLSSVGLAPAAWREPPRGRARHISILKGLGALYRGRVAGRIRPDLLFSDQWHPWMTMHVSQYALSDRSRSYLQVYRYDQAKFRSNLKRGMAVVRRYRAEAGGVAGQWRDAHPELTSWERWDRILGLLN